MTEERFEALAIDLALMLGEAEVMAHERATSDAELLAAFEKICHRAILPPLRALLVEDGSDDVDVEAGLLLNAATAVRQQAAARLQPTEGRA